MKGLYLVFGIACLFQSQFSLAGCPSGTKAMMAAVLIEQTYPEYFQAKQLLVSKKAESIDSAIELAKFKKQVDWLQKTIERVESQYVDCLNSKANSYLVDRIANMELSTGKPVGAAGRTAEERQAYITWKTSGKTVTPVDGFTGGDSYIKKGFELVVELRGLYPTIDANIEQANKAAQQERLAAEQENQELQDKLTKEKRELEKLEAEVAKKRKLEAELRQAEIRKAELERQKNIISKPAPSPAPQSSNPYLGQEGFSSGLNTQAAGDGYIKKNRVICFSKSASDRQIELLVRNEKRFAPGCFSTPENQNAWFKSASWGECVVERVSDGKDIWIDCGDFVRW